MLMNETSDPPLSPDHSVRFDVAHGSLHDPEAATVQLACHRGEYGMARLSFLRLRESSQLQLLESIPRGEAVRLVGGLSTYTVARLYERVPKSLGRAIVRALPESKRHGVSVILDYRRRI